jgi:predicted MPP superfamily phosphohydrolase
MRWRRPQPIAVVGNHSRIVDAADELGDKPVGNGSHWRLACLPGNQIFQVELRELSLRMPRWPAALDGLSILHLSDVHLNGTPGRQFYQCIFDHVMSQGPPDILAITGDVVDSPHHHRWVIPLIGRLKWNIAAFAILGNHDKYYEPELVRRRLRRLGVRVIGNDYEVIDVRGVPLLVVGNEAPWFRPAADLSSAPRDAFRLCLSHTPDQFAWAQANSIDLMLAGHVHGGQIRLPLIGPLFVPSRFSRRYDSGQFQSGPTLMVVSRGLAGREPLRYNCRPEIGRIVLKCG